jgi:TonB family protein
MAPPPVYRIPRRFISFPEDPRPYGPLAASFLGHLLVFGAAIVLSAWLGSQLDQSRVYVVNLVPATPSLGSPEAAAPSAPRREPAPPRPAPKPAAKPAPPPEVKPAPRVEAKAPPRPEAKPPPRPEVKPPPRVEAKAPPRPAAVEPPPRLEPPPRPEREPELPRSRAPELARARPIEPSELALPRRAEKEPAVPQPTGVRERLTERSLPPPPPVVPATPPAAAPRLPEPPPVTPPPPALARPAPPAPAAAVAPPGRPAVDPIRLGRPNAPSAATGSIAIDASDFPFTYYLRLIQSKIGERWTPPRAAAAGGERTIVLFEIQRDGQVREPTVERSSGNTLYDQSALRAVTEASPFPPLPPEFKASSLRVHFGFEFNPDQG